MGKSRWWCGLSFRNERYKMILRCAPVLHEWLHDHALACCNGWVPMPGCILPKYLWQHVYGIQAVQAWQRPTWNPVEHPPSTSRPPLININFMEKIVPNAEQRHNFRLGRDAYLPLFRRFSHSCSPIWHLRMLGYVRFRLTFTRSSMLSIFLYLFAFLGFSWTKVFLINFTVYWQFYFRSFIVLFGILVTERNQIMQCFLDLYITNLYY